MGFEFFLTAILTLQSVFIWSLANDLHIYKNMKKQQNYHLYLNVLEIENETVSKVTKKKKPLNLNLAEPSEVKSLAFLFSLC